jgi:hypothetical protein
MIGNKPVRKKVVITELENELKQGIVVSVDNTSARYRNLPID